MYDGKAATTHQATMRRAGEASTLFLDYEGFLQEERH